MLTRDGNDNYRDLHWGKYDCPMAHYIYEAVLLNGDFGDEEYSDGDGTWGNRYGRRVLEGDNAGFVYCTTFDTEDEAAARFREVAATFDLEDEDR